LSAVALIGCGASDGASEDASGIVSDPAAQQQGESSGSSGSAASSAAGSLDPSFGASGKVTTSNIAPSGAVKAALQPDGNIVVATTLSNQFGVVRYLPSGTLDSSFGSGGVVRTSLTNGFDTVKSMAIDGAGRIVVAGSASDPTNATAVVGIVRYEANGTLDASFGRGGVVTTSLLGNRDVGNVVLLEPDGKILVGGSALTCFGRGCVNDTALVRYDANGALDSTFGSGGKSVTKGNGAVDALALENDGSILVLDANALASHSPQAAMRFGSAGGTTPLALGGGVLSAIATGGPATFEADGKIVVGRGAHGAGRFGVNVQTLRFTLADVADSSWSSPAFAFDGPVVNGQNLAQAIAIDAKGRVLVGGIAAMSTPPRAFGLARLAPTGALDASFGKGGIVTTEFATNSSDDSQLTSMVVQPDGKIVAVGLTRVDDFGDTGIALARYMGD